MSIYNENIIWIRKSIESILKQTYENLEFIIIIDNPNLDPEIRNYLMQISTVDQRIQLIWNEKNIGLAASLNRGIQIAQGKYIARMDADDISFSNRLEKEIDFIEKGNFDLISANKINIDEDGNIINKDKIITRNPNQMLQYSNIIVHPLVLVKTSVIKKMGGYRKLINSEDLDLWLRMIEAGYRIGILNEYLLYYRIRCNSASIERQLEQYYANKYILKLRKERIKKGKDTFSAENQKEFIRRKNITEWKKKRFYKSNLYVQRSLDNIDESKIKSFVYIICSFYEYPVLILGKIKNTFLTYKKRSENNVFF